MGFGQRYGISAFEFADEETRVCRAYSEGFV